MQHNFRCSDDLCKLGKEYLNSLTRKFYRFFLDKFRKLLTYYNTRLSTTNRRKVINSERQSGLFWRTLYINLTKN